MPALVSPDTQTRLKQLLTRQTGSYLVVGPAANGKFTTLLELARTKSTNPLNLMIVEPEEGSLKIHQIHELTRQLRFKEAEAGKRMVIIRDADQLTLEAQNAFLKTLEEPPIDTVVILIASSTSNLLPTILSRCQIIQFGSVDESAAKDYLVQSLNLSDRDSQELWDLSHQTIGRAVDLASSEHLLAEQKLISEATSQLINQADPYSRLKIVLKLEGQIEIANLFTNLLKRLQQNLYQSLRDTDLGLTAKIVAQLRTCQHAADYLLGHGNAKLALIYTALNL